VSLGFEDHGAEGGEGFEVQAEGDVVEGYGGHGGLVVGYWSLGELIENGVRWN